jgi:hypothetical protein
LKEEQSPAGTLRSVANGSIPEQSFQLMLHTALRYINFPLLGYLLQAEKTVSPHDCDQRSLSKNISIHRADSKSGFKVFFRPSKSLFHGLSPCHYYLKPSLLVDPDDIFNCARSTVFRDRTERVRSNGTEQAVRDHPTRHPGSSSSDFITRGTMGNAVSRFATMAL